MQPFKMNTTNMNYCETSKNINLSKRITMLEFICLISYLYIYYIIYKKTNAYFNKKIEEKVEETVETSLEEEKEELEEDLTLIRPVDEEETLQIYEFEGTGEQLRRLRAYNPKNEDETEEDYVSRIWSMAVQEDAEEEKNREIKIEEEDEIYEYEFRSEQLRRLRAHNPKLDGETPDKYSNRIHYMAYIEDEKEEKERKQAELKVEEVKVEEVKENDVNTWYKFADGKGRYKGEWKNGLPNGRGIKHSYKDDSYIYGNFVDGYTEGYGKQTFEQTWEKTQPYYEGEFNRNNYDGKGEYHYGDGDYYKGMWKNNKYHGQGAAYSKRLDKTWVGEYENDVKGEGNWVKGEI